MPVCMVLVELAITCVHDYMVVTVTFTKIYGKMNFNRWALAITAALTTLQSQFPTTGYARVLLFICTRRELGGTGTGCLFQFTYFVVMCIEIYSLLFCFQWITYSELSTYN